MRMGKARFSACIKIALSSTGISGARISDAISDVISIIRWIRGNVTVNASGSDINGGFVLFGGGAVSLRNRGQHGGRRRRPERVVVVAAAAAATSLAAPFVASQHLETAEKKEASPSLPLQPSNLHNKYLCKI